jgi:hypothetical protein
MSAMLGLRNNVFVLSLTVWMRASMAFIMFFCMLCMARATIPGIGSDISMTAMPAKALENPLINEDVAEQARLLPPAEDEIQEID